MAKKDVIPFKYYGRFIAVSVLLVIAISTVIYTNFINDDKFNFPFAKFMKEGQEVTRIYPASSFNTLVQDDNPLTFEQAKKFINTNLSYKDISDYSFGKIDHYANNGIYKVYDRFDDNYLTLYERDKKITGFSYKYLVNRSGTSEFPEREYIYQDIMRIEKIIGSNYTVENNKGSKSFIAKSHDKMKFIYVFTIIAKDTTDNTLGEIVSKNKDISLNISVFNSAESYGDTKLVIEN